MIRTILALFVMIGGWQLAAESCAGKSCRTIRSRPTGLYTCQIARDRLAELKRRDLKAVRCEAAEPRA